MRQLIDFRHLGKLAAITLVILGFFVLWHSVDFGVVLKPEQLATTLDDLGMFAPVVFMLLMTIAVVISPIPSIPLDVAAGAAFGTLLGTTYGVIGAEIGAILSFLIGRALGREVISRLLRVDVVFCETCSDRHLMVAVFIARLLPIFSFDLISYGAGLTNMSLKAFAIVTLFGMIPPTLILTHFGSSVVSVQWPLLLSGAVMVVLFLFLPKLLMRYRSMWVANLFLRTPPVGVEIQRAQAGLTTQACPACGASPK